MATADQLLEAIRAERDNPGIDWAVPPQPLVGGFSTLMWRVALTGDDHLLGDLVARVLSEDDDEPREIDLQRYLADSGYATPSVRLSGRPGPLLNRAWMLMEHVDGAPLLDDLSGVSVMLRLPSLARSIPETLARCAASLHSCNPGPLIDAGWSGDGVIGLVDQMRDRMNACDRADLAGVADVLLATAPVSDRLVVCHGDLHPLNVLVGPDGEIVIDWTTAQLADPTYDLAFTSLLLGHPPLVAPRALKPVVSRAGRLLARRFLDSYCRQTNFRIDADAMDWFTLVGALRVLVEMANLRRDPHGVPDNHPFSTIESALEQVVHSRQHRAKLR